ncbi:anhydro-N-acetylmuramic acid kinase [Gilvimarinus sp. F26214L]|uniref:anhydro-N-acetylmuramic acid kinase n=1 Tax=Gilvimarinus sp. DZF01 TaxID=3461371 RepID=UPI0040463134
MSDPRELYVGLMSGTSADCIDAVLVDLSSSQPRFIHQLAFPMDAATRAAIYELMVPGDGEIDQMGVLDQQLGHDFADAVTQLLAEAGIAPTEVQAIGSHGQTIRHRPPGQLDAAFTVQIGDPSVIAERSGITTVADFRRRDMAAGGQGAPLVPAFHRAVFHSSSRNRVILNIGGIANITFLPQDGEPLGFDTGPGNALMDAWIQRHHNEPFDWDGHWAGTGRAVPGLLEQLLEHPYFAQAAPKSTGREMFTLNWLLEALGAHPDLPPQDVQATLMELTAQSISNHIQGLEGGRELDIYVCGGGAHSKGLMRQLAEKMPEHSLGTTEELGIPPDWVEAGAFAWLAQQTLARRPGNLPTVTGARRAVILGGVYYA